MSHRLLLISAVLAAAAGLAGVAQADIVAVDSGIAVKESDGVAPSRGMSMSQVASRFGDPITKVPAVGKPPISRWEYPGFVVYFERDHVIHSVVSESAPPLPASEPAQASPSEVPAASVSAPPPSSAAPAAVDPPVPAAAAETPAEPPPAP